MLSERYKNYTNTLGNPAKQLDFPYIVRYIDHMRVLAYLRISSKKQETNSSLEHQKKSIVTYCELNKLTLNEEDIFIEVASGAQLERTEFNRMREVIKNSQEIKHLVVYAIDRLTRSVHVGEVIAKEIREKKGSIISVSQGFDDSTPNGRFTRQLLTAVAEQERETIAARVHSGRRAALKKGLFGGGQAPTGYKTVGTPGIRGYGQLVVDEKERATIEQIFSLKEKGHSYREISKRLTERGILTRKMTPFNPGTIKKIIDNKNFYTAQESLYEDDGVSLPQHPAILEES